MKNAIKIILIILSILLVLFLIDTVQAMLFNNRPIFKIAEDYNGGTLYRKDKGILVDTYTCTNNEKQTVFKWEKFDCQVDTEKSDEITDNYIAIFHGGSGEIIYETYVYKINNGQANYGFNYINVTKTTTSYGSSKWDTKITKRGSVDWTDNVFGVAEENNAYSYVTLPNSDKTYTIEEFQYMFLMD